MPALAPVDKANALFFDTTKARLAYLGSMVKLGYIDRETAPDLKRGELSTLEMIAKIHMGQWELGSTGSLLWADAVRRLFRDGRLPEFAELLEARQALVLCLERLNGRPAKEIFDTLGPADGDFPAFLARFPK